MENWLYPPAAPQLQPQLQRQLQAQLPPQQQLSFQGYQPPQGSLRKKPDRRKPAKFQPLPPAPAKSVPEEEEPLQAGKRSRKPPSWLQAAFDDLPALVAGQEQQEEQQEEQQQQQQQQQQQEQEQGRLGRPPVKGRVGQASKAINWRLLDMHNMVVEIDHEGQRYRGVLERSGACPSVGIVQESYQPSTAPTTSASTKESRELCALCNHSLMERQPGVEEELQRVVRVQVSSMWLAHVHLSCGLWAPEVFEDKEGNLANIASAIRRSRGLRCHKCHQRGASLGCYQPGCNFVFHLPCARACGCELYENDYMLYCPTHASKRDARRRLG